MKEIVLPVPGENKCWITTAKDLCTHVINDYENEDTELNGLFFDFPVDMKKAEIIRAYNAIQQRVNGDYIAHLDDSGKEVSLEEALKGERYAGRFRGCCREFLESVANDGFLVRFCEDEAIEFIF